MQSVCPSTSCQPHSPHRRFQQFSAPATLGPSLPHQAHRTTVSRNTLHQDQNQSLPSQPVATGAVPRGDPNIPSTPAFYEAGESDGGAGLGRSLLGETHVVSWCVGLNRILGRQGDAAHGDDHEDAHLKVAQVQDVVAQAAKAVEDRQTSRGPLRQQALEPFCSAISLYHLPLSEISNSHHTQESIKLLSLGALLGQWSPPQRKIIPISVYKFLSLPNHPLGTS